MNSGANIEPMPTAAAIASPTGFSGPPSSASVVADLSTASSVSFVRFVPTFEEGVDRSGLGGSVWVDTVGRGADDGASVWVDIGADGGGSVCVDTV